MLGDGVSRAFAQRLPYLLKVIAPERPLSLQVHPGREHAAESFAAENAAGLPLDSPQRRYRDANHKPEMLVALTRFEALCGFRTPRRAATLLERLGTELTDRLHELLVQQQILDCAAELDQPGLVASLVIARGEIGVERFLVAERARNHDAGNIAL